MSDEDDACPDEPGLTTEDPKTNGCPLARRVGDRIVLAQPMFFSVTTRAVAIGPVQALTAIAAYLSTHPEVKKLRVEARAKDPDPKLIAPLSIKVAQEIVDELVAKGVSRKRLEARVSKTADSVDLVIVGK